MGRYYIAGELKEDNSKSVQIDIINPEYDNTHLYRNLFEIESEMVKNQVDPCLNKYDLNAAILDAIIQHDIKSKLWTIDPNYITLDMALRLAKSGNGMYISERLKKLWELSVIRYVSGERDFIDLSERKDRERFYDEADYAETDLEGYIIHFLSEYKGYTDYDQEAYKLEENRATDFELARLQDKEDICLDLIKDIIVVRRRILDRQNNIK